MRVYEKPAMMVERFAPNAVCSGCTRVKIDESTEFVKNQQIYCIATSSSDNCFNSAVGCGHSVRIVTVSGTYYSNDSRSLATWINNGASESTMNQYRVNTSGGSYSASGTYVVWSDNNGNHAGPATSEILEKFGFSY